MKFDDIISLGSNCNIGLSLRQLNLKSKTYPFDWIRSNSKIIYDVLINGREKYLDLNSDKSDDYYTKHLDIIDFKNFPITHINTYGQFFTHYDNISQYELIHKFNKYFDRFFEILGSGKTILFIHSHEEYIYHKKSRDDKDIFYDYLCKINDLLIEKYPTLKFTILNIDIDNNHQYYKNIVNLSMIYNLNISDNSETHTQEYYEPYREQVTGLIKKYLEKVEKVENICNTWALDAWSIGPHTFKKITELLPDNSIILELGSGAATNLLSSFYRMKSIEEDINYMYRYNSTYFLVPTVINYNKYIEFPEDPTWYDINILKDRLVEVGAYDCILIDGPKGFRGGLYYHKELFNLHNSLLIFDDTHDVHHHRLMVLISEYLSKPYEEFVDGNKKFGVIQK